MSGLEAYSRRHSEAWQKRRRTIPGTKVSLLVVESGHAPAQDCILSKGLRAPAAQAQLAGKFYT